MESSVGICGAGTMGRGIALAVATRGIPVILYERDPEMLQKAASFLEEELGREISKNRITPKDKEKIQERMVFTSMMSECRAPLIIEAITEKTESKSALFQELAAVNDSETVFATNTSSLSVTTIASQTRFPERIIGLHFFNPAYRMKLVEIIQTKYSTDRILERVKDFVLQIGKTPVICRDDPGFIVNHVARPYYLEALRLAENKIADINTIDILMESAGFRMGPFHLMDLIGNDINFTVSQVLYDALGMPGRLQPSGLQHTMIKNGRLGKKTGSGFFQYTKPVNE